MRCLICGSFDNEIVGYFLSRKSKNIGGPTTVDVGSGYRRKRVTFCEMCKPSVIKSSKEDGVRLHRLKMK